MLLLLSGIAVVLVGSRGGNGVCRALMDVETRIRVVRLRIAVPEFARDRSAEEIHVAMPQPQRRLRLTAASANTAANANTATNATTAAFCYVEAHRKRRI